MNSTPTTAPTTAPVTIQVISKPLTMNSTPTIAPVTIQVISTVQIPNIHPDITVIDDIPVWLNANLNYKINLEQFEGIIQWCCIAGRPDILAPVFTRYFKQLAVSAYNKKALIAKLPSIQTTDTLYEELYAAIVDEKLGSVFNENVVSSALHDCCRLGHFETACLLLRECGKYVCNRLLISAVMTKALNIAEEILTKYKHLLTQTYIDSGVALAYDHEGLEMAALFLANLSDLSLRNICVGALNASCEVGHERVTQQLLQLRRDLFKIEDLKINKDVSDIKPAIVDMLYEAFGDALLERYPSWTDFVRSRVQH